MGDVSTCKTWGYFKKFCLFFFIFIIFLFSFIYLISIGFAVRITTCINLQAFTVVVVHSCWCAKRSVPTLQEDCAIIT